MTKDTNKSAFESVLLNEDELMGALSGIYRIHQITSQGQMQSLI